MIFSFLGNSILNHPKIKCNINHPNISNIKPINSLVQHSPNSKNQTFVFSYPCLSETDCDPYDCVLEMGKWKFELWGTSGTYTSLYEGEPGHGAYVTGIINLYEPKTLHFYLGSRKGPFNGGGGGLRGGSATDVRLKDGNWYEFESLLSRIIVAGAGGAHERVSGGNGGGLNGGSTSELYVKDTVSNTKPAKGGTQKSGGDGGVTKTSDNVCYGSKGGFGYGGGDEYLSCVNDGGPGGGSGYFGGGSIPWAGGGGGGSSFISGHPGCVALSQQSTEENIKFLGSPIHFSQTIFEETEIIDGNQTMPMPDNTIGKGIEGNGIIKLVYLNGFTKQWLKKRENYQNLDFIKIFIISSLGLVK